MTNKTDSSLPSEAKRKAPQKQAATVADLLGKKARTDTIELPLTMDDGTVLVRTVTMRALSAVAYDALEAKYPPTAEQQKRNLVYDINAFAPALISACALEPKMSLEEATELYESEEWSAGEISGLFFAAQRLCNAGLDVSFTAAG